MEESVSGWKAWARWQSKASRGIDLIIDVMDGADRLLGNGFFSKNIFTHPPNQFLRKILSWVVSPSHWDVRTDNNWMWQEAKNRLIAQVHTQRNNTKYEFNAG
jgi:hypothetical protein